MNLYQMNRLTIILDTNLTTSVNDDVIIVSKDKVPFRDNLVEWFYDALQYSSILKSELELDRRLVYDKVRLNFNDYNNNLIEFSNDKLYRDNLFSKCNKYSHPSMKYPIKVANPYSFYCDSLTYDKVSNITYKNVSTFNFNKNMVDIESGDKIDSLRYGFYKCLIILNIVSYDG